MLTSVDIDNIFARVYSIAALEAGRDMSVATDLLESLRPQFYRDSDYKIWTRMRLDQSKYENSFCIALLIALKKEFYEGLYQANLKFIYDYKLHTDAQEVNDRFIIAYTEALVHWRSEIYARLCREKLPYTSDFGEQLDKCREINRLFNDSQWWEVFDKLDELQQYKTLPKNLAAVLEVMKGQIVLYFHSNKSLAWDYFERAKAMDPDSTRPDKAMGEFYFRTGQYDKASSMLMPLITREPFDVDLYNLMGDANREKGDLQAAEGWYTDAIEINYFYPDTYGKIISLYGSKTELFNENKSKISSLLEKVKQYDSDHQEGNIYYSSLRDAGLAYANNGDYDTAADYYTRAKEMKPQLTSADVDLGYIRIYQKSFVESESILKKVLNKDPKCYEALWGLAYHHEQNGQLDLSLKAYEKCMQLREAWKDKIYNSMGVACYNLNKYDLAETYYREAIKLNPGETLYKKNLDQSLEKQGKKDVVTQTEQKSQTMIQNTNKPTGTPQVPVGNTTDGLKATVAGGNNDQVLYLEKQAKELEGRGDYKAAEEALLQIIAIDPTKNNYNALGNLFFRQQLFDKAIEYYAKAIEVGPKDAVIFENMGLAHERKGIIDKAEEYYNKGLEVAPDDPYINNRMGVLKYNQFKDDEAIVHYNKAIGSNPNNAIYYTNLGLAWESKKNFDEAEKAYLKAYGVDPKDSETCNNLGILKYKQEKYEEAIGYYNQAIQSKGNDDVYYSNLGKAYTKINSKEALVEAIKAFTKAVELNPKNDQHRNYLGVTYYKQYDSAKALEQYQEAVKIKADNYVYYDNIGLAYKDLGNLEESIKNFLKAGELAPDKEKWFYHNEVGVIYHNRHNYAKAIEQYEVSIKYNPSNETVWQNLASAHAALGNADKQKEALDRASVLTQKS